jgi:DNA polymerase-3 subunit gamma/tau
LLEIVDSIDESRSSAALDGLRRALDSGADPRTLSKQIVEYVRALLMIRLGNASEVEATEGVRQRMVAQADHFSSVELLQMLKRFNAAATDTRGGWQPALSLELALAGTLEERAAPPASRPRGSDGPPGQTSVRSGGAEYSSYSDGTPRRSNMAIPRSAVGGQLAAAPVMREREPDQPANIGGGGGADTAPSVVGLSEVAKAWKEIRLALRHGHPAVGALLNSSKPVEVKGDVLYIGFQSETVRSLMDKPDNIKAARHAIAQVLGWELKINCVVTNTRGRVPPHLAQDGMVASAVDRGGEIVDVQEHSANRGNESP